MPTTSGVAGRRGFDAIRPAASSTVSSWLAARATTSWCEPMAWPSESQAAVASAAPTTATVINFFMFGIACLEGYGILEAPEYIRAGFGRHGLRARGGGAGTCRARAGARARAEVCG